MAAESAQVEAGTLADARAHVLFLPSPGPGVDHFSPARAVLVAKEVVASSQWLVVFLAAAPCGGRE